MRRVLFTIPLLILAACGGATAPQPPLNGTWVGSLGSEVLTLVLHQGPGTVSGTGSLANTAYGTLALHESGTYQNNMLSLNLVPDSSQYLPATLEATLTGGGGTLDATLYADGHSYDIALIKQH